MFDEGDLAAMFLLWLAFMSVVGVYVIRIGLMLMEQRAMERHLRLRLAMMRGRAAREAADSAPERGA